MSSETTAYEQDGSVTAELPAYFIAMQIKDFYRKSYTQEMLEEYPHKFEPAVIHWTDFVRKRKNNKLPIPDIKPADLFEFSEKFSKSEAIAIACLCFLYDYIAKEGFLIE
jgi:hypothetical protein